MSSPAAASAAPSLSFYTSYIQGPWSIAVYTWREGIRKKTLVGFLILSLLVIFGSFFMGSFLDYETVGDVDTDINFKLVKDISISTISIFGVLITIFISASVVPTEMENKVIYSVLSKPVRRMQYLIGKFLGVQLIVLSNLILMGGLFVCAMMIQQRVFPTLMLWSIFLTYFEFLIISAFTFAVSCTSTSSVLPTIAGLFIYIVGNLTEYLKDVYDRSALSEDFLDKAIGYVSFGLWNVIPNLQNFSIKTQILNGQPNDPINQEMIPQLVIYGLVYAVSGYLIAYLIFRRREL